MGGLLSAAPSLHSSQYYRIVEGYRWARLCYHLPLVDPQLLELLDHLHLSSLLFKSRLIESKLKPKPWIRIHLLQHQPYNLPLCLDHLDNFRRGHFQHLHQVSCSNGGTPGYPSNAVNKDIGVLQAFVDESGALLKVDSQIEIGVVKSGQIQVVWKIQVGMVEFMIFGCCDYSLDVVIQIGRGYTSEYLQALCCLQIPHIHLPEKVRC